MSHFEKNTKKSLLNVKLRVLRNYSVQQRRLFYCVAEAFTVMRRLLLPSKSERLVSAQRRLMPSGVTFLVLGVKIESQTLIKDIKLSELNIQSRKFAKNKNKYTFMQNCNHHSQEKFQLYLCFCIVFNLLLCFLQKNI